MKTLTLSLLAALSASSVTGLVLDNIWLGPLSGGLWSEGNNWSQDVIPNNNATDQYRAIIPTSGYNIGFDQNSTIDELSLPGGSQLTIANGRILSLDEGQITGGGLIQFNTGISLTQLLATGSAPTTLSGGGTIDLGDFTASRMSSQSTAGWINQDWTIRGAGTLIANAGSFDNQGAIIADGTNTLFVDPSSAGFINSGTMLSTAGANLEIGNGVISNNSGLIYADPSSKITLSGADITGGSVGLDNLSILELSNSTLTNVDLTNNASGTIDVTSLSDIIGGSVNNPLGGVINITNGDRLDIDGSTTFTNAGSINLLATTLSTSLRADGSTPVILTGGGTINLSDHGSNALQSNVDTSGWINVDNTIRGSGNIINNVGSFENQSFIIADQATPLKIDPSTAHAMINTGVLRATNGATLQLVNGAFVNTSGQIDIDPSSNLETSGADISGGNLTFDNMANWSSSTTTLSNVTTALSSTSSLTVTGETTFIGGVLTTPAGSVIDISNGDRLNIDGATSLTNGGDINLNASTLATTLRATGATPVTLSGGGTINLSDHGSNNMTSDSDTAGWINIDHLIRGSGQIISNQGSFENQGTIRADQPTMLTIDPDNAMPMVNSGLLEATNNATLRIHFGEVNNVSGGAINIGDGSTLEVNNATINNGQLSLGAGSSFNPGASTFNGVNFSNSSTGILTTQLGTTSFVGGQINNPFGGQINIDDGDVLEIDGSTTLFNSGDINILANSFGTTLRATGTSPVIITGGGFINLSDDPSNFMNATNASAGWVNVDNTIRGSGTLINNAGSFENQSLVLADQTNPLAIKPAADLPFINTGTMRAISGATLLVQNGDVNNTGGLIDIQSGSILNLNNADVTGGTVAMADNTTLELFSSLLAPNNFSNSTGSVVNSSGLSDLGGNIFNDSSAIINIANGSTLDFLGGAVVTNNGVIQLQGTTATTTLGVDGGSVTFTGPGLITSFDDPQNRIRGVNNTDILLNESGHTISMAGQIGANTLLLNNRGVIENVGLTPLQIDTTNGLDSFNSGDIRAVGGGTVEINASQLVNEESTISGLLEAQAGSLLKIQNSTVSFGLLQNQGDGVIQVTGSSLDGIQITNGSTGGFEIGSGLTTITNSAVNNQTGATIQLLNSATLGLGSGTTLNNAGRIEINGTTSLTRLRIDAPNVDLTGGGELFFNNDPQSSLNGDVIGNRLTNVDNHIFGGGSINDNRIALTNRGDFEATGAFNINLTDSVDNYNTGLFLAPTGGVFNISSTTIKQNEGLGSIGTMHADGGVYNFTNSNVEDGFLDSSVGGQFNFNSTGNSLRDVIAKANINVNNGARLSVYNSLTNQGQIRVLGSTATTDLEFGADGGGSAILDGGGVIILNDDPQSTISAINGGDTLINVDNTISGAGNFGLDQLVIQNQASGTIRADGTTPLTINAHDTGGIVNEGLFTGDGGALHLVDSTVNNATGMFEATNGGSLALSSDSIITGGSVQAVNGGLIQLGDGELLGGTVFIDPSSVLSATSGVSRLSGNVTNQNLITLENAATLILDNLGVYNNFGEFQINGTTATTTLQIDTQATLSGGGVLRLNGDPQSRIIGLSNDAILINQDNEIRGGGFIGSNSLAIDNRGKIIANNPGLALTVDPTNAETIFNTGEFRAENGATLQISGNINNTGGGILNPDVGSTIHFNTTSSVFGGQVGGFGDTNIGSSVTFENLVINGPVNINNAASLTLIGNIFNQGSINNQGTTATTDLLISDEVTLDGAGLITFLDDPQSRLSGVNNTTAHLINENNTISGAGQIGVDRVRLTNRGLIQFDAGTVSGNLNVADNIASVNAGQIITEDGATVTITDSHIINEEGATTGFIAVGDTAVINTSFTTLEGGDLFSFDNDFDPLTDGVFRATGPTTLRNLNLATIFEVNNGATLTLREAINNQREIRVNGSTATTTLSIGDGGAVLDGFGIIELQDDPQSRISASTTGNLLINNNNTIRGGGLIGVGFMRLQNFGQIEATGTTPLTINTNDATFSNQGQLIASGAGGLKIQENLENNGGGLFIQPGSLADINGSYTQIGNGASLIDGMLMVTSGVFNNDGIIGGSGQIIGNVTNAGMLMPGSPDTGQLDIDGNLSLSSTSSMFIEIGGATAGLDFDVLHITGSAILDGDFQFEVINGFTPSFSDSFIVLSSSFLTGDFAQLNGSTIFSDNGAWEATIHYGSSSIFNPNQVTLNNFTPVPEPQTYALFALGGGMILWWLRRRKQAARA